MNDLAQGCLPVTLTTVDGEKNGLPLVVTPGTARNVVELVAWLRAVPAWHKQQLLNHGAILFRGFGVSTPQEFESLARAVDPELKNEYLGTSPRDALTEYVFSASELPDYYPIPEHCEMTFTAHPPRRIFFWCGIEPKSPGGETPIVDFARVWKELDPAVRERFEMHGIRIVRNYAGPDETRRDLLQLKRWDQMFRTTDKIKVEAMARAEGFEPQWHEHGRLTLISRHPAARPHPETGQPVWFNHAQVFHLSTAGAELKRIFRYRPSLRALGFWAFAAALVGWKRLTVAPDAQAMHCTYESGEEIPRADMEHLRDVIWNNLVVYAWRQGDVVAIDNNRVGHGRLPYRGKRMVAVCWA